MPPRRYLTRLRDIRQTIPEAFPVKISLPVLHVNIPSPLSSPFRATLSRVTDITSRVICLLLIIIQGSLLDYYLIAYNSTLWSAWILADILSVLAISSSLLASYKHFRKSWKKRWRNQSPQSEGDHHIRERIPPFLTWSVYSLALIARVAVIFKYTAHKLTYTDVLGPNMLKTQLALTAIIYLLFVWCHHDALPLSPRNTYISYLSGGVTLDIFDSITLLNILFTLESRVLLPYSLENAIIFFACVNLFLPTLALMRLMSEQFGHVPGDFTLRVGHTTCYLIFVNLPYTCIRIHLYKLEQDISVFLIKNIIGVAIAIRVIYFECLRRADERIINTPPKDEVVVMVDKLVDIDGSGDDRSDEKALSQFQQLPGRHIQSNLDLPTWWKGSPETQIQPTTSSAGTITEVDETAPSLQVPGGSTSKKRPEKTHSLIDIVTELIKERRTAEASATKTSPVKTKKLKRLKLLQTSQMRPRTKTM